LTIKSVIKRSGATERFDAEKLSHWAEWADTVGADWVEIVREVFLASEAEVTTSQLQNKLISVCEQRCLPAYDKMAGRLFVGGLYKTLYGTIDSVPTLQDFYKEMVALGYWADMGYPDDQLSKINQFLDHDKDLTYTYSQLKQLVGKYSAQDRVNKVLFESPQFTFIRMALGCAQKDKNLSDIKAWYTKFSDTVVNCPTPNYNNLGTYSNSYASCCLYGVGDTAMSQSVGDHIADVMTFNSAGTGSHLKTRSPKDPVKGGVIEHHGKSSYIRSNKAAVSKQTQGGRGGSCTVHFNASDPEVFDLIQLRNIKTVPEKRIGGIDYSLGSTREFRRRVALNLDWPLFSYYYEPDLYESIYTGDDSFEKSLAEYEANPVKKKNYVNAREVLSLSLQQMPETGRFYDHYITEINRHTPFKEKIYCSNLCQEIVQPIQPYYSMEDLYSPEDHGRGEISLCTLSAINVPNLGLTVVDGDFTEKSINDYYEACYYALKMIDNIIDIASYPFPHLALTSKARRNAGVGITGLAYELALKNLKYSSQEGKDYNHMLAELHSWCLHKASIQLAKERGVNEWAHKTKYPEGWLPIDTYCKNVDKITSQPLLRDWEALRAEFMAMGGGRFSVLEAHMPCESSSIACGSPNGLYPIRGLVVGKKDATSSKIFIAPDMDTIGHQYELAWDVGNKNMLETYAIYQKFDGQAISADWYIERTVESNGIDKFSESVMVDDYLYAGWLGVKTRYYANAQNDGDIESKRTKCVGDACTM
jgi:ribonucleoside-diphosphate reductase alpha chain